MGNAYNAVTGDASSVSDNPAGIIGIKKLELTAFHAPLYLDVLFDSAFVVLPTRKMGNFGIGWQGVHAGEFEKRVDPLDTASTFGVFEQAGYVSYAYRISSLLAGGISGKIVRHKIDSFSDTSFGADIGFILFPPFPKNLQLGLRMANIIAPKITLIAREEQYALRTRLGVAYSMYDIFRSYGHDMVFTFDIEKQEYPVYRLSYGVEYGLNDIIFMRLGLDDRVLATGMGVKMGNYRVDYAVSSHDLGLTQKFSVSMRFGYTLAEMEYIQNKKYERMTRKDARTLSRSYTMIGLQLYDDKRYEEAIDEWEKALIWNPKNEKPAELKNTTRLMLDELKIKKELRDHEVLAHAYFSEKKWSDSLSEWERVLNIDRNHKKASESIEVIKDKISVSVREREQYKKLKSMTKKGEISRLNHEGWGYYKVGQYTGAINSWKKIFGYDYENKTALNNIGMANKAIEKTVKKHMEKGKTYYEGSLTSKAIEEFNKILTLEPGHADATRYLELSRKQALEQVRRNPVEPQILDQLYFKAADLYLKDEYGKTLDVLNEILRMDPTNENAMQLKDKTKAAANFNDK